uniref:Uncharacterized protein LOC114339644 n=1 Tax=Diabrotica virgifera virgifera TaxID=50390 RepID=A0A6P7GJG7_DIAVI
DNNLIIYFGENHILLSVLQLTQNLDIVVDSVVRKRELTKQDTGDRDFPSHFLVLNKLSLLLEGPIAGDATTRRQHLTSVVAAAMQHSPSTVAALDLIGHEHPCPGRQVNAVPSDIKKLLKHQMSQV